MLPCLGSNGWKRRYRTADDEVMTMSFEPEETAKTRASSNDLPVTGYPICPTVLRYGDHVVKFRNLEIRSR